MPDESKEEHKSSSEESQNDSKNTILKLGNDDKKNRPKKDSLDIVLDNVGKTMDFIKSDFKGLFIRMLKLTCAKYLCQIALLLLFMILGLLMLSVAGLSVANIQQSAIFSDIWILGSFAVLIFLLFFLMFWVSGVFDLIYPLFLDEHLKGNSKSTIVDSFSELLWSGLRYQVLRSFIFCLVISPPLVLAGVFLLFDHAFFSAVAFLIFGPWLVLSSLILAVISQFWSMEISVERLGTLKALKASFRVVKNNLLSVISMDIILLIALCLISIPFFLIGIILDILARFGSVLLIFMGPAVMVSVALFIFIYLLIKLLLEIMKTSISNSTLLPYMLLCWRELRERS